MMRVHRRRLVPTALVGLSAVVLGYAFTPGSKALPPPAFPKGSIASVTITLIDDSTLVPTLTATSADADKIEALAAVLRRGESRPDHKCASVGRLAFRSKDGSESVVGILPGHDRAHYEYRADVGRVGGNFRVDRDPFLRALAALGVSRLGPRGR